MMAGSVTSASNRYLSILLFIGLPAALITFTILNGLQIATDRQSIEDNEIQIAAMTRRLQARAPHGTEPSESIYLSGMSRTAALANLQQLVVNAIASASGRLIETAAVEASGTSDENAPGLIQLRATLDIDNDGLLKLLYALESGTPFINVATLSIRMLPSDDRKMRVDIGTIANWKEGVSRE